MMLVISSRTASLKFFMKGIIMYRAASRIEHGEINKDGRVETFVFEPHQKIEGLSKKVIASLLESKAIYDADDDQKKHDQVAADEKAAADKVVADRVAAQKAADEKAAADLKNKATA
jgi:hypothetical protein